MAVTANVILLLVSILPAVGAQTCFFQDQYAATGLVPCLGAISKGGQGLACCGPGDYCLDNGLCFSPKSLFLYRGGCTDSTWVSNNCGNYCREYTASGSDLWPCGNNAFACDPNSCNASFPVPEGTLVLNQALSSALSLSAATSAATTTATATSTTTVTITPAATTVAAKGTISTSDAAAIGAGIGAPLLIALIAVLLLLFREYKKRRLDKAATPYISELTPALAGYRQDGQPAYDNVRNVHQRGPDYGNVNKYGNQGLYNELDSTSSGARQPYESPR